MVKCIVRWKKLGVNEEMDQGLSFEESEIMQIDVCKIITLIIPRERQKGLSVVLALDVRGLG